MNCRILIDADGSPVVEESVELAQQFQLECFILCDTAHQIEREGAKTFVFSKGNDSVDFALVNLIHQHDIVITQDYGLAAMCLAKRARVLRQDGLEYTIDNIESLLNQRYVGQKIRRSKMKLHQKGPKKRTAEDDEAFVIALTALLKQEENQAKRRNIDDSSHTM